MVTRRDGSNRVKIGSDGLSYDLVPCGKCFACRKERSQAWGLRLMLESIEHKDNVFLTLTYDELDVPYVTDGVNFYKSLKKTDLQKFWKRLRKDLDYKISYYAVGEYGDETGRPHYHAIVFGLSAYERQIVQDNWTHGHVEVDSVDLASCYYVAGYCQKKLYDTDFPDVVQKPFSCMSKGLAKIFVENNWKQMLDDGFIRYKGIKYPIPRYFWKMMLSDDSIPLSEFDLQSYKFHQRTKAMDLIDYKYSRLGVFDEVLRGQLEDRAREARACANKSLARQRRTKL